MRMINYRHSSPVGAPDSAILLIKKDGIYVTEKEPGYLRDSDIIRRIIAQAIDSSGWSHSWHMDVGKARIKGSKERKKTAQIIEDRVAATERHLKFLQDARQLLKRWH